MAASSSSSSSSVAMYTPPATLAARHNAALAQQAPKSLSAHLSLSTPYYPLALTPPTAAAAALDEGIDTSSDAPTSQQQPVSGALDTPTSPFRHDVTYDLNELPPELSLVAHADLKCLGNFRSSLPKDTMAAANDPAVLKCLTVEHFARLRHKNGESVLGLSGICPRQALVWPQVWVPNQREWAIIGAANPALIETLRDRKLLPYAALSRVERDRARLAAAAPTQLALEPIGRAAAAASSSQGTDALLALSAIGKTQGHGEPAPDDAWMRAINTTATHLHRERQNGTAAPSVLAPDTPPAPATPQHKRPVEPSAPHSSPKRVIKPQSKAPLTAAAAAPALALVDSTYDSDSASDNGGITHFSDDDELLPPAPTPSRQAAKPSPNPKAKPKAKPAAAPASPKSKPSTLATPVKAKPAAPVAVPAAPTVPAAPKRVKGPGVAKAAAAAASADTTSAAPAPLRQDTLATVDKRYEFTRTFLFNLRGALAGDPATLKRLAIMDEDARYYNPRLFEMQTDDRVVYTMPEFHSVAAPLILALVDAARTEPMRLLVGHVDPTGGRHLSGLAAAAHDDAMQQ